MKGSSPFWDGMRGKVGNYVVTQKGDESIVRKRVMENPTRSQAQVDHQIGFKAGSQGFQLLSPAGRESYIELGARMLSKRGKPLSGSNAYSSVTATRALMSLEPLDMAPAAPPVPGPQVPSPLFLSSVNDGAFQLLIHSEQHLGPVLLEACPWVSAGVSYFSKSSFRVCAVLPGLTISQTAVTSEFLSRFSTPPASSQMVVRLTPLTEEGFRGATTIYSAFVAPTEAEMLADLEERKAKRGRKPVLQMVA